MAARPATSAAGLATSHGARAAGKAPSKEAVPHAAAASAIAPVSLERGREHASTLDRMRRWRTSAAPWFGVAVVVFVVALLVLRGTAENVTMAAGFAVLLGACMRAVALAVRDDDVSSSAIRGPAERVLGMMGADSPAARRRRRLERERRGE